MRKAISQQHATDWMGLNIVPLRCHQLGQLSAASLESTLTAHTGCGCHSRVLFFNACRWLKVQSHEVATKQQRHEWGASQQQQQQQQHEDSVLGWSSAVLREHMSDSTINTARTCCVQARYPQSGVCMFGGGGFCSQGVVIGTQLPVVVGCRAGLGRQVYCVHFTNTTKACLCAEHEHHPVTT